jgi:hypothetical protein
VPTTFGLARIRREPRVNVPQLNKDAISMLYMTVLGTKDKPHGKPHIDFLLHPGVTAGQILDHLKLKDYVLFPLPNPVHYLHLGSPAVANTVAMLRGVKHMNEAIHIRIYITS